MKKMLTILGLVALIIMTSVSVTSAISLRMEDFGMGSAPGFVVFTPLPVTEGLEVGFGLAAVSTLSTELEADVKFGPKADVTFIKENIYGRVATSLMKDWEFDPYFGVGYRFYIAEWFGAEAEYGWDFLKDEDQNEYVEWNEGRVSLNIFAHF